MKPDASFLNKCFMPIALRQPRVRKAVPVMGDKEFKQVAEAAGCENAKLLSVRTINWATRVGYRCQRERTAAV